MELEAMGMTKEEGEEEKKKEEEVNTLFDNTPKVYYLPTEVAVHNKRNDVWLSYLTIVVDLTSLVESWEDEREIAPILAYAGKDVSHWFDKERADIKHVIDSRTGIKIPYCPHGPIIHASINMAYPCTKWKPIELPWWRDSKYRKGFLTSNPRPVALRNTRVGPKLLTEVCEEDTMVMIQQRVLKNVKYKLRWFHNFKELRPEYTLTENGICDLRKIYLDLGHTEEMARPHIVYVKAARFDPARKT